MISIRQLVVAALLALPVTLPAQTTRGWHLCFTGGVLSCTDITLTTTPQLVGGTRTGTLFDLSLSYFESSAWRSALQDVSLTFAPLASDEVANGPATLLDFTTPGGASGAGQAQRWAGYASSSPTDPAASALILSSHPSAFGLFEDPATSWFIGGCGVGAQAGVIDPIITTSLWTCGAGATYFASFLSSATLDADRVTSLGVDLYRAYPGDGVPLAPFCVARTDLSGSIGTAEGDFSDFGDVCSIRAISTTTAPEPTGILLMTTALAFLIPLVRRTGTHNPRADS
jgi:hypothetical protein